MRYIEDVEPVPCPCGSSTGIITRADTELASLHVTEIKDSERHYHKETTEYYYILKGTGKMELGEEVVYLRPGTTMYIAPGVPHRGYGDFKTIVVSIPAFREDDVIHAGD